jgi:hypothetical protein
VPELPELPELPLVELCEPHAASPRSREDTARIAALLVQVLACMA